MGRCRQQKAKHPVLHVLDHEPTRSELHKALVELDGLRLCVGNVCLHVTEEMKRLRRLCLERKEMCDMALRPTIIKPVRPAVKPVVRPIEVTILAPKRKPTKRKTTTTKPKEAK